MRMVDTPIVKYICFSFSKLTFLTIKNSLTSLMCMAAAWTCFLFVFSSRDQNELQKDKSLSAHDQLFGFPRGRGGSQGLPPSPTKSDPPSPVFKSAAAREIIKEMAWEAEKHRRVVPKEKRRHFTISSSKPLSLETGSGLEEVFCLLCFLTSFYLLLFM